MARELLGNLKGPQGEQGEQGPQGPPGENPLEGVNANLLSLSRHNWEVGAISSTTGVNTVNSSRLRMNYFLDIVPGEVYTVSVLSSSSSYNRLNWYEYDDGVYGGVDYWSGAYPSNYTFTAKGNNIKFGLYFDSPVDESTMDDMVIKLEKGSERTPYPDVLSGIDRKIEQSANYGYVSVTADPFDIGNTTSVSPTVVKSFTVDENTEHIDSGDGKFTLSPGFWDINISTRPTTNNIDGGYALGLYHNGSLIRRATKDIRSEITLDISTTLNIKLGDTIYFGFSMFDVSSSDFNAFEFTLRGQAGNNKITMKKVGV